LPDGIKPEYGVFVTSLVTAFNAILDSNIKLGDTVAVSGLGVLGQLVVQMAKMSGAHKVFGIDLFDRRLKAALENGAHKVYNPTEYRDIAYEIRKQTDNTGADAVIEISGNQKALNEAIRIAAPDAQVTAAGWYQGKCTDIDLSEEFHHNRIKLRCSQTGGINPALSNTWDRPRRQKACMEILQKLKLDNIITNVFDYEDASKAYEMIENEPEEIIQAVFKY
jgi:threonine dehydrogenase-like Zn-dependent dehydrogenase